MSAQQPLYRVLASTLRDKIMRGVLKPGDSLPTEHELCAEQNISRHTAREALRLLSEEGLIARKRGIGTIVTKSKAPAFAQSIGDFDRLLQYARDTSLTIDDRYSPDDDMLAEQGLSGPFVLFTGYRRAGDADPVALTRIFIQRTHAPSMAAARQLKGSFSEWIEYTHQKEIASVTQRMEAIALNASEARRLNVAKGSPALRTIRRYRDADEKILLLSESLHPAGRFAYEMRLKRNR